MLGLEINDAGIALADAQQLLTASPGYAWYHDGGTEFGESARRHARRAPRDVEARFWRELDEAALGSAAFADRTAADLVQQHLDELLRSHAADSEPIAVAVPGRWTNEQLGRLLGIADELQRPIAGFVDSAAAATRRRYPGATLIHIDASLFDVTLTQIEQGDFAAVGRRDVCDSVGIATLERLSIDYFAALFVAQTRFDPLHDAGSEQALAEALNEWLDRLARERDCTLRLNVAGSDIEAQAAFDDFAAALERALEPVVQRLRGMLSTDRSNALQICGPLMSWPGAAETFARLPRAEVFGLPTGAAAIGLASRARCFDASVARRRLLRMPWDQPDADIAVTEQPRAAVAAAAPTHAVVGGRAYRLDGATFYVGTELAATEFGVQIDSGHSGVSRRHCAIAASGAGIELIDHSRHGTALNGHSIDGNALLQPGDRVVFGSPPIEILLVAEEQRDGA